MKQFFLFVSISLSVPLVLLGIIFFSPEPISRVFAEYGSYPIEFLFGDNKQLLNKLTLMLFDRTTTNFAPIIIFLSVVFWFLVTLVLLLFLSFIKNNRTTKRS